MSLKIERGGDSYSIRFNLCDSPGLYHQNRNQRKRVHLFPHLHFRLKNTHFLRCFLYKTRKKLSPWKMKKNSWISPGILFAISVRILGGSGPPGKSQVAIGFLLNTGMDPLEKPLFLKGGLYGLRWWHTKKMLSLNLWSIYIESQLYVFFQLLCLLRCSKPINLNTADIAEKVLQLNRD